MDLDYTWLRSVENELNSNSIFAYTITGAKALAMAFLLFRVISQFLTTGENDDKPKIGGIITIIGYGLIIVGSDWIVTTIEGIFSGVNVDVSTMAKENTMSPASRQLQLINETAETMGTMSKIAFYFSIMGTYAVLIFTFIISVVLQTVDVAITSMYLLQRLFLIQLFKFIFPFAVAFSTLKETQDLFFRWIKIFIGLFVLGIAYIAIIKFSVIVYNTISAQVKVGMAEITTAFSVAKVFIAEVGALFIAFAVKIGLMSFVTREVRGYFS